MVRACPNESYSRARAAFDATFPPCRRRALLPSKAALAHFFRAAPALGHRRRPFRLPLNCVGPPPGLPIRFFANTSELGIFDFKMNFRPIKFASRELTQPFKWGRACAQVPPQAEIVEPRAAEKKNSTLT